MGEQVAERLMRTCEFCGAEFEAKHSRHRFCSADCRRGRVEMGVHVGALVVQVEAMATGREHRALIAVLSDLAALLDASDEVDDKMFREYRLALKDLGEVWSGDRVDSYQEFLAGFRGGPEVRDS